MFKTLELKPLRRKAEWSNEAEKESLEAEKKKLSMEITILELYISQKESVLDTMIHRKQSSAAARSIQKNCTNNTSSDDSKDIITNELSTYAGLSVEPSRDGFTVFFLTQNVDWIRMRKVGNNLKLDSYSMPECVTVQNLSSMFRADFSDNKIQFLKTCKRFVDCHYRRMQQFKELEIFLQNNDRCVLSADFGNMKMTLKLTKLGSYAVSIISIKLTYRIHETRPYLVESECNNSHVLSHAERKSLRVFIKTNFKLDDLTVAVSRLLTSSETQFVWKPVLLDCTGDISEEDIFDVTSIVSSPMFHTVVIDDHGDDVIETLKSLSSANKSSKRDNDFESNKRKHESRSLLRKNKRSATTSELCFGNKENFSF